jgi:hypothetical protein
MGLDNDHLANRGVNMIKVHCMHVWKHHNETPHFAQLIYTNKVWYIYTMEYYSAFNKEFCHLQQYGWN